MLNFWLTRCTFLFRFTHVVCRAPFTHAGNHPATHSVHEPVPDYGGDSQFQSPYQARASSTSTTYSNDGKGNGRGVPFFWHQFMNHNPTSDFGGDSHFQPSPYQARASSTSTIYSNDGKCKGGRVGWSTHVWLMLFDSFCFDCCCVVIMLIACFM